MKGCTKVMCDFCTPLGVSLIHQVKIIHASMLRTQCRAELLSCKQHHDLVASGDKFTHGIYR